MNHESKVRNKYNYLIKSESVFKNSEVYPIHKKLDFGALEYEDIYYWLLDYIDFNPGYNVLDAGCGVGFGSVLIAKTYSDVNVHGISLSELEIARASKYAEQSKVKNHTLFEVRSYNDIEENVYDVIICIESIKHSNDLSLSLDKMKKALKSKGQLIIVEDYYKKQELTEDAMQLCSDYKLLDLYRESDYYASLNKNQCIEHNLNKFVLPKINWKIETKLFLSRLVNKLTGSKKEGISSILRGGYHLDRLYAQGNMEYKAIIYTKS